MKRVAATWGTFVLVAACGKAPPSEMGTSATAADETSTSGTTTDAPDEDDAADADSDDGMAETTPPETGPSDESDDSNADDSVGFVLPPDGGGENECDPRTQDCMRGQKCTAWANDGGTFWNANKCVEISGEGVSGDSCMIEGSGVSGIDDCGLGFICLNTDMDGIGTCVQFCQGDNEDCDPGDVCAIYNDGVLPICLVGCDPLLQDCPEGQGCIDTPNSSFICFNDASGDMGADGDPCPPADGENSCDPGMWCGPNSSGCTDVNCCTAYCDINEAQCPQPDECVSFFGDPESAPPGFENVGVCVMP